MFDNLELSNLTSVEKLVVRTIASNGVFILKMNIDELATQSMTTKSTIVKTLKKLGINGFKDLKKQIIEHEMNKFSANVLTANQTQSNINEHVISIINTQNKISKELIDEWIKITSNVKQIFVVCGHGIKEIANLFANMLSRLGFLAKCIYYESPELCNITVDDAVIFISNSGLNSHILQNCLQIKRVNPDCKLIAITTTSVCNIKEFVNIHFAGGGIFLSSWEYYLPILGSQVLCYICSTLAYELLCSDIGKYRKYME